MYESTEVLYIMKKTFSRIISFLLVAVMISAMLISCTDPNKNNGTTPAPDTTTAPDKWQMPEDEYTIPMEDGYNQITFYWSHPSVSANAVLSLI